MMTPIGKTEEISTWLVVPHMYLILSQIADISYQLEIWACRSLINKNALELLKKIWMQNHVISYIIEKKCIVGVFFNVSNQ